MIAALFFLEDAQTNPCGLISPETLIRRLSISARSFAVERLVMVDLTRYQSGRHYRHSSRSIEFEYHSTLAPALERYRDQELVFLDLKQNIERLKRPGENLFHSKPPRADALYIVGPDGLDILSRISTSGLRARWLFIPMACPDGVLYAEYALLIAFCVHARKAGWLSL